MRMRSLVKAGVALTAVAAGIVLVPEGFDSHPEAHYPLIVFHDHFVSGFNDFRESPPDPNLKPDYSDRFHLAGYNRIMQQEAYKNYQAWIAPGTPRVLIVKLQHANAYYDDSYAPSKPNWSRRSSGSSARSARAGRDLCTAARRAVGSRLRCKCFIRTTTTARS